MVEYISATINGLWECYLSWSKQKRELTISKLEALSNLLIDNRTYLRDFAHQGIKDAQKELELAKEWRRVALLFQDILLSCHTYVSRNQTTGYIQIDIPSRKLMS